MREVVWFKKFPFKVSMFSPSVSKSLTLKEDKGTEKVVQETTKAGTAVCPEAIYTDVLGFQKSEESLMGVCLMKTHIRVTIAVLDIDYLVTVTSTPVKGMHP